MNPSLGHRHWLSPIKVGSQLLPTRFALAPINTGFSHDGLPTDRLVNFHRRRSGAGIGLSMVGNVAIAASVATNSNTAVFDRIESIPRYSLLAAAIREAGSLAGIQLAAAPSNLDVRRQWQNPTKGRELARLRDMVDRMSASTIDQTLKQFEASAELAAAAGFQIIQVHAAHGYFLSLLTSTLTNSRTDKFAQEGSWLEDFVERLRSAISPAALSFRISTLVGLANAESEAVASSELGKRLTRSGVDLLDLSAGFYTMDRRLIYPGREFGEPVYAAWRSLFLTDLPAKATIVAGRIRETSPVYQAAEDGLILAFGRALIADAQFVGKLSGSVPGPANECILKNKCHYFTRGKSELDCGVNPGAM